MNGTMRKQSRGQTCDFGDSRFAVAKTALWNSKNRKPDPSSSVFCVLKKCYLRQLVTQLIAQRFRVVARRHYKEHVTLMPELCERRSHDRVLRMPVHIRRVLLHIRETYCFHLLLNYAPNVVVRLDCLAGQIDTSPKQSRDSHAHLLLCRSGKSVELTGAQASRLQSQGSKPLRPARTLALQSSSQKGHRMNSQAPFDWQQVGLLLRTDDWAVANHEVAWRWRTRVRQRECSGCRCLGANRVGG